MLQSTLALLATSFLVLGSAKAASAATSSQEVLVHETATEVEITLTPETVICSAADYGAFFLKVLLPELAPLTLLDHQNFGVNAPCVAAGMCSIDLSPDTILDADDETEVVEIVVRAVRVDNVDDEAETCITSLIERVDVVIRGVPFAHERYAELGSRPFGDCAAEGGDSEVPPEDGDDDSPDDDLDSPEDDDPIKGDNGAEPAPASPGGCSVVSPAAAGGGTVVLVFFGLVAACRRRRRA